jgi:hypothetical protein
MSEQLRESVAANVEAEIVNEVFEMVESGELDEMVDAEMKREESFTDKILNIFVKN